MRIIAGSSKGHPLKVPREVSRPTTDRVRESVFGILAAVIPDARVLDLYAGSGALGIEALSRGAVSCTFVEQNRGSVPDYRGEFEEDG
jgi:16S rRNA (guanine966-N2)-methyltransferase